MVSVTFTSGSDVRSIETKSGYTLMEAAINAGIDGIDAKCGGGCSCGTCHVHIPPAFSDSFTPPDDVERDMLEMVQNRSPTSRLACQITLTEAHDGLSVFVPHPNGPE